MKVILLDEIKGKGGEGDVVEVAQGYAENRQRDQGCLRGQDGHR